MYLVGQGHEHFGPGTGTVQRINWTTGQEMQVGDSFGRGMGCGSCGGKCAGKCGLGLFDGGFDPSTWGPLEIGIVALGGYMLLSTFLTTQRAVRSTGRAVRKVKRSAKSLVRKKASSEASNK